MVVRNRHDGSINVERTVRAFSLAPFSIIFIETKIRRPRRAAARGTMKLQKLAIMAAGWEKWGGRKKMG